MNIHDSCTQSEFAELVGITQPTVSRWVADGLLPEGGTCAQWLVAYCHRLREQAAGRLGAEAGGLDLATERAALARAQREGIEIKNAVLRGEYAPIALLAEVLAQASAAVAERFDHLPGTLKKACPELTEAERAQVLGVIASARNEWVRQTARLVAGNLGVPELADEDPADGDDAEGAPT